MNEITVFVTLFILHLSECSIVQINGALGKSVILQCPFERGKSTIQWLKVDTLTIISNDDTLNPDLAVSERFEIIENDGGTYDLLIKYTDISDDGLYQCEGIIDGKPKSAQIELKVFSNTSNDETTPSNITTNMTIDQNKGFSRFLLIGIGVSGFIFVFTVVTVITPFLKRQNVFETHQEMLPDITTNDIQASVEMNILPMPYQPVARCTTEYQSLQNIQRSYSPYDQLMLAN